MEAPPLPPSLFVWRYDGETLVMMSLESFFCHRRVLDSVQSEFKTIFKRKLSQRFWGKGDITSCLLSVTIVEKI